MLPASFSGVFLGKWEIPTCVYLSPLSQETAFEGRGQGWILKQKQVLVSLEKKIETEQRG